MENIKSRLFFDVFNNMLVPNELLKIFQDVKILKILASLDNDILYVEIRSKHIISKKNINKMENIIQKYMFNYKSTQVKIREQYILSEQYTLSKLTNIYKNSILYEIGLLSNLEYNLLKNAKWEFIDEKNIMLLDLDDNLIAVNKSENIGRFLTKIYKERFNIDIKVKFKYSKLQKDIINYNKNKLQYEVVSIMDSNKDNNLNIKNTNNTKNENKVLSKPKTKENIEIKQHQENKQYSENNFYKRAKKDNDVFFGKNCDGEEIDIIKLEDEQGEVIIKGKILKLETKEIRMEKTIVIFNITDFTDTITCKIFIKNDNLVNLLDNLKEGGFYKIKGIAMFDKFEKDVSISSIIGIKKIPDFTEKRKDLSMEKRVELHLHTVMSDMDAVVDIKTVINRAKEWGHKAVAITDHGVAQAFPIANHEVKKDEPFKIIYGMEGYFVNDLKEMVLNEKGQTIDDSYVVFDLETTGFSPIRNKIIEIGAVKVRNGKIIQEFSEFVNPETPIPFNIEKLTGINDNMVSKADKIENILPKFLEFCKGSALVAHNASFDTGFIRENARKCSLEYDFTVLDTVEMAHFLLPNLKKYKLDIVAKNLGVSLENHHRAVDDAMATAEIFIKFIKMLKERNINKLSELNKYSKSTPDMIKKALYYHGIILVKNEIGRKNLYRLISESHINYFNRRPRIPKSLIVKYREGLIIGSACEAGELYQAIISEKTIEEINNIVNFYDYLEIQPIGNNRFMLENDKYPNINNNEDLQEINKYIVKLGEQSNKLVVATCDVHFLDPQDEIYRRILMKGQGFKDADNQPPLYFRTTEEMLEEFMYLGFDKAKEVVITNTNLIADQIEKISPVLPDKYPPIIDKSDETLRNICYDKAHQIYGKNLPEIVKERLDRELNSIISNGFAVMYIIAQKLVWKSNEDGYLVGSRGSVGSSFVATMAGITEVNPLPAHYICPNCFYSDFDSDEVKVYAKSGSSGCDMPDRNCPKCGHPLNKEGHDIPFETFLGFQGNKEPDIDLNFSGEYQSKAHDYTEVIFGKGHVFRAGTIGTIADKTAIGYVYKYYDELDIHKRRCEIERIALGCTGVKRTTGQHPGGIIVVPKDQEIYSFTPIQRPANDVDTKTITTHFEYHSIDHNLLKLDILGHDDPTMIRMLEDLTGIDAKSIKLDDKDVMSIFHSTEALGITPDDIGGIPLGSLGIPEFGTDFVIQMLIDTKPKSFSDLVRISGLSHGTDVWLGNAQTLIAEGKAEISTAICTRDDIMTYLINKGLEKELSFTIMENVRKGKGLKPEWEKVMLEHNVPDWYIWSCKKIKYMFPKAHAAAYVMMAWRIAYFKVFYPIEYYTAYFSIRASAFSYEKMCQGKEILFQNIKELSNMSKDKMTAKDQDSLKDLKSVQEMYARGIEFIPIDLKIADDRHFQIIDGKIMPSLNTIDGLGEKAAEAVKIAVKNGEFLSIEDFRERTKVSKSVIDKMVAMGLLKGLSENNQLSFEF